MYILKFEKSSPYLRNYYLIREKSFQTLEYFLEILSFIIHFDESYLCKVFTFTIT